MNAFQGEEEVGERVCEVLVSFLASLVLCTLHLVQGED